MLGIEPPVYNLIGRNMTQKQDKSMRSVDDSQGTFAKQAISNKSSNQTGQPKDINPSRNKPIKMDEFIELGLLEKQFKKAYQINNDDSDGSASLNFDIFNLLRNRLKIKINNDHHLTDKHLVADIRQRNEALEELLQYFYVMHLIEFGNQNIEERTKRPEDEALINIIDALGFMTTKCRNIKPAKKNLQSANEDMEVMPEAIYSFSYESKGGSKWSTDVYSMSIFSQNRGRRSMIISSNSAESDPYMLITFGNERSMKHLISPSRSKKEDNLLKVMIAKQKQRGLKTMIAAKKALTAEQVSSYTREYDKISNSARDQIEDLERLATQIETDLEYVGCIGLRDSIREEAVSLTKQLHRGGIRMSIMSGDQLENCLTVVNKLGLSLIDIQNSSSFYWIHSNNEKAIMQELRRIFGKIHDVLQNESYKDIEALLKKEKENTQELDHQVSIRVDKNTKDPKEDHDQADSRVTFESLDKFRRSLLLSGTSVDCIMASKTLVDHLSAVLSASGTVVAYDLRPKHKAFLTDMLINCGDVVLAIGDGFNDIGMLSRANFGIQISNKDVPLIFGDIVVNSLSNIAPLIFDCGFSLKKNILMSFIVLVWMSVSLAFTPLMLSYYTYFHYPLRLTGLISFITNIFYLLVTLLTISNKSYDAIIMNRYPIIYKENQILVDNLAKIMMAFLLVAVIESVLTVISIVLFLSPGLHENGYVFAFEDVNCFYLSIVILGNCIKLVLTLSRFTVKTVIWLIIPTTALYIISVISQSTAAQSMIWSLIWSLSYKINIYCVIILTVALGYIDFIVISIFKKHYFNPVSSLLTRHIKDDAGSLTNRKVMDYISEKSSFSNSKLYLQVISAIKKQFNKSQFMDLSLKRIISLDFHNSNMGLSRFTNRIVNDEERRRFLRYITKKLNLKKAKYFTATMCIVGGIEWAIIASLKSSYWLAALDTIAPYFCVCMLVILTVAITRPRIVYHTQYSTLD